MRRDIGKPRPTHKQTFGTIYLAPCNIKGKIGWKRKRGRGIGGGNRRPTVMAIWVVEFSSGGYKIRKIFA